jgi:protein-S-isoprenylcysteine O-methyltransferase Ste14
VALAEEIKMGKERGQEYEAYRASAPFMLPLPKFVSVVITAPMRLLLHKDRPENGKELLVTVVVYLVILVVLSLPFILLDVPGYLGWGAWPSMSGPIRPWFLRW